MMMPSLLKSDSCIKTFNLIKSIIEEYDDSYFKVKQLLKFIKQKQPDLDIAPQFLGKALEWLKYQGVVEKWGILTWKKLDGEKSGRK